MRLIDADGLVKRYFSEDARIALSYADKIWMRRLINGSPTVDAEPVRHGHWIVEATGDCCYRCSECQFLRDAYSLDVGNYCPNCGARMSAEDNT